MAKPLIVSLPPDIEMGGDWIVRVTAVDPDTGNTVSGVQVSNVTLEVDLTSPHRDSTQPLVKLLRPA